MKNWKSLLALFLALILAVGVLAGCQTTSQPDDLSLIHISEPTRP